MKSKAQLNYEVMKEQEEELINIIENGNVNYRYSKDELKQLFKGIRQTEYRRAKEDVNNDFKTLITTYENRIIEKDRAIDLLDKTRERLEKEKLLAFQEGLQAQRTKDLIPILKLQEKILKVQKELKDKCQWGTDENVNGAWVRNVIDKIFADNFGSDGGGLE